MHFYSLTYRYQLLTLTYLLTYRYGLVIMGLELSVFAMVSRLLTEFENYRTHTAHESAYVFKMFFFIFVGDLPTAALLPPLPYLLTYLLTYLLI